MNHIMLDDRYYTGITLIGHHVYLCVYNGDIYRIINGEIMATCQAHRRWTDIICYKKTLYACVYGGDIYEQKESNDLNALHQAARHWVRLEIIKEKLCAYDREGVKYVYDGKDFIREFCKTVQIEGTVYNILNKSINHRGEQ